MRYPLVLLYSVFCATPALAQQADDTLYPTEQTIATVAALSTRLDSLDTARGRASRRLGTRLQRSGVATRNGPVTRALDRQEATWVRYRTAACGLVGALTDVEGSWPAARALQCEIDLAATRLGVVQNVTACVEAIPAEVRDAQAVGCVWPLAVFRGPDLDELSD